MSHNCLAEHIDVKSSVPVGGVRIRKVAAAASMSAGTISIGSPEGEEAARVADDVVKRPSKLRAALVVPSTAVVIVSI